MSRLQPKRLETKGSNLGDQNAPEDDRDASKILSYTK